MPLIAGTRLGPYEIQSAVGAGGMGEVYRARDTRLDRTVAIKVLPTHLSSNLDLKARFEREARAISSLSHPNICRLYDVGTQDGVDFLVMEYLEGETLAERLAKGLLPIEQVLKVGIDIADALDKAHRQGIIHRDLKPANIMLTKAGVKLMDFGLAKPTGITAAGSSGAAPSFTAAPTASSPVSPLTSAGTVVGTIQYMSPEQIEGKEADTRSDIFSFGAVLYEMATGKKAFGGKSQISVASAILEKDPEPITQVQPMLERLVPRCLAKDPEERFQTAHDLKMVLEWMTDSSSVAAAGPAFRKRQTWWLPWAVAAVIAAAMVTLAWWSHRPEVRRTYAAILPPENTQFHLAGNFGAPPALSPDGRWLVFGAGPALWVRSLTDGSLRSLAGTDGAAFPFWSPDSRRIGFFADGKLKVIDAGGGAPVSVCDAPNSRGGTWSRDGVILFAPNTRTGIYKVPAAGGKPTPLTQVDTSIYSTHRWPHFLPDGKHFLYFAGNYLKPESEQAGVYLASLDNKGTRLLIHTLAGAIYSSGYVLYLRQNTLMAQPLSLRTLSLEGEAIRVADNVVLDLAVWQGIFTSSTTGMLAYASGTSPTGTQLAWYDRRGKELGKVLEKSSYFCPRISHDGNRFTFVLGDPNGDVWVYDVRSGTRTRFSFNATVNSEAVWSPDDQYIAFPAKPDRNVVYIKPSSGAADPKAVGSPEDELFAPTDWSPDGRRLALDKGDTGNTRVWIMPPQGGDPGNPFSPPGVIAYGGRFSPNGRWLAYTSHETGRGEVYVAAFPGPGGRWQVSSAGGRFPMWRHDGKELFFFSPDNTIMAAEVEGSGPSFQLRAIRSLFQTNMAPGLRISMNNADMAPDGRILITRAAAESGPALTLVINWTAELKTN